MTKLTLTSGTDKRSAMVRLDKPSATSFSTVSSKDVKSNFLMTSPAVGKETAEVRDAQWDQQGEQ
jgi:hypothetical protein